MLIWLVIARYAHGYRDERAFVSQRAASAYAAAQRTAASVDLHEVPVVGELERSGVAYTVRWHDAIPDFDNVEIIYGNDTAARLAAGGYGKVLQVAIDSTDDAEAALHSTLDSDHKLIHFHPAAAKVLHNRLLRLRNPER